MQVIQQVIQFREILLWPLRWVWNTSGERSSGITELNRAFDYLTSDSLWDPVDPYERTECPNSQGQPENMTPERTRYAEFVYFHPFVQDFLYAQGVSSPVRIAQRCDVRGVQVKLAPLKWGGAPREVRLHVDRVHLYLFQSGVAVLVVEVRGEKIDLLDVEDILDSLRRAYPPYWCIASVDGESVLRGGHCPLEVRWLDANGKGFTATENGTAVEIRDDYAAEERHQAAAKLERRPPMALHWRWLLRPLSDEPNAAVRIEQIEDERIPLTAYLSFENPGDLTDQDMIRLAMADDSGSPSNWPYSEAFLRDFFQEHAYDRFWDQKALRERKSTWLTTRYLCTGYAFVMIGKDEPYFFADPEAGALSHFRHHYFQMALVVHMHKAALLIFSRRLAEAVKGLDGTPAGEKRFLTQVAQIQEDIADFVSRFWFTEVSNHVQPREIMELWRKHLALDRLFQEVMEENRFASEVFHSKRQREIEKQGHVASMLGNHINMLVSGALPLTVLLSACSIDDFQKWLASWAGWFEAPLILGVSLVSSFVLLQWLNRKRRIEEEKVE